VGRHSPGADHGSCWIVALSLVPAVAFLLCSPLPGDAMKQPAHRRLAAILAADVAGYSRLMGVDEAGTAQALREHRAAADPLIAQHGGRIVKTTGDGMLSEFASVVGAVQCAIALQRLATERNADSPGDRRMEWRIGIHLGDVLVEGDDVMGSTLRHDWRASPNRVASAFPMTPFARCAARSRPSLLILASRASKTLLGRGASTARARHQRQSRRQLRRPHCRSQTSRRSQYCPLPI
jgi:Adenylate and Guanylate cyclase catalytic domain